MANKFIVKFTNDAVDPSNFQLVDMDVRMVGKTVNEAAAQILCYFATVGFATAGGVTKIADLLYRPFGSPGAISLAFPTTEYNAVLAAATSDGQSPAGMASGYATQVSAAGSLTPLGTSISVSEVTGTAGPRGRGRHFLPFIGANTVDGQGRVLAAVLATIKQKYEYFILGLDNPGGLIPAPPVSDLQPVVQPASGLTTNAIILVKPQPVFSNLESRRR